MTRWPLEHRRRSAAGADRKLGVTNGLHIDSILRCRHIDSMTRTQIQLPDETYARAKKLCEAREISLAELARRGIEYILSVYDPEPEKNREWHPPKPRKLGWMGLSDEEIKREAQLTNTEIRLARRTKK